MTPSDTSIGEGSLLLWLLAAMLAALSSHVFLSWVRVAQRQPTLRSSWLALLTAAFCFGTGLCAVVVLSLTATPLSFPIGYRMVAVPALWLGAMAAGLLPAYWLMHRQNALALMACGLLMGAAAVLVQAGWLTAGGFQPGIYWRKPWIAAATLLMLVGMVVALWVAFTGSADDRDQPSRRIGSGVLMAVVMLASQELLMAGADLTQQTGSIFVEDVPALALCLAGGVLAPLAMGVMLLELEMRRSMDKRSRRDAGRSMAPRRRRRKHRMRTL